MYLDIAIVIGAILLSGVLGIVVATIYHRSVTSIDASRPPSDEWTPYTIEWWKKKWHDEGYQAYPSEAPVPYLYDTLAYDQWVKGWWDRYEAEDTAKSSPDGNSGRDRE